MSAKSHRLLACMLALWCTGRQVTGYGNPATKEELTQPIPPPATPAEVDALRQAILHESEQLRGESSPEPVQENQANAEANKTAVAVRTGLIDRLSAFAALLGEYSATITEREQVENTEGLARQSDKLLALQRRIDDLRAAKAAAPTSVTDGEVNAAEAAWSEANDDMIQEAVARSDRAKRIAELIEQRDAIAEQVARTEGLLTEEAAGTAASGISEAEATLARYRVRSAQIDASLALLSQAHAEARMTLDTRLVEDAEQRLPLLREITSLLDDQCENLRRIQSRNERQQIVDWVDFVYSYPDRLSAAERAYWPMRLVISDAELEIRNMRDESGIADRFPEDKHADLTSDLAVQQAIWSQFVSSLDRRPREQIQQRYREILQHIRKWQARRDQLRGLYDTTFDDQARIEFRLSELDESVRVQLRETRTVLDSSPQDRQVMDRRKQLTESKQSLDEQSRSLAQELKQLIERLSDANRSLATHIGNLETIRGKMYWSFLSIADVPLWKYRWSRSVEEWNDPTRRQKRSQDVAALRGGWARVTPPAWATLAVILLVSAVASLWLRAHATRSANRLEGMMIARVQSSEMPPVTLSDRIHLQGLRLIARTSLVILPGFGLWAWLRMTPADSGLAHTTLLFVCGVPLAFALTRFGFVAKDARLRLLPCSDRVAMHFRWWARLLLFVSIIGLPIPLFLSTMEWAFNTRVHLWSLYMLVMIGLVFVFLIKRQMVLGILGQGGPAQRSLTFMLVAALYPAMQLFLLVLLAMQLIGYGELNRYLLAGVSATLATVVAASMLRRYVVDLLARLQESLRKSAAEAEARRQEEEAARAAALSAGREVALAPRAANAAESGLPVGVVSSVLRLAVWIGATVVVLQCWGVRWDHLRGWMDLELASATGDRPAITIGRALLAVVTVLASWMVSRSVRTILDTKVYPTYAQLDRGGRVAVNTVLHYMLLLIGVYFGMYLLRIPLGAVTVVLGTVGLGLGLASQPLFMNFLSGLIMLFERHVKVGDIVEIDGNLGEVTNISIRATTIKTFDNVDLVIPNGDFVASKVINWTLKDERVRGKLPIGVAYGSDPRLVERLLLQVAMESSLVLRDPPPRVRFLDFGDSSLQFALYGWFRNVSDRWDFVTDARYRVFELFHQHGIEIPFPQREFSFREDQALRVEVVSDIDPTPREPAGPAARFVRTLPAAEREGK